MAFSCTNRLFTLHNFFLWLLQSKIEDKYNKEWQRVTREILKFNDVQRLREFIVNNINFIHYQDHKGLTPLHVAAEQGHELCVKELLEHGALPNARATDLKTPADLANSQGHRKIAKIIEAKIQVEDNEKQVVTVVLLSIT